MSKDWVYLGRKPKSAYEQLFVKGRNIRAFTLYAMSVVGEEEPPLTPEEIAREYDLPVPAVLEAIAYCRSEPPALRTDWDRDEARARSLAAKSCNGAAIFEKTIPDDAPVSR